MDWYYVENGTRKGPVGEQEFAGLLANGIVGPQTLVWHAGMTEWQPHGSVAAPAYAFSSAQPSAPPVPATGGAEFCSECGRSYPAQDLMQYGSSRVCASCKPAFMQKLREGSVVAGGMVYGGFWIRFVALLIDSLILGAVSFVLNFALGLGVAGSSTNTGVLGAIFGISTAINVGIAVAYNAYFWTKYGATPGKMALGLKVVNPDGSLISVGKAIGRYFCYFLDSLTLLIGYIIAAFDDQKRALHDRICETRVIKVRN